VNLAWEVESSKDVVYNDVVEIDAQGLQGFLQLFLLLLRELVEFQRLVRLSKLSRDLLPLCAGTEIAAS
jgi:hypothetical protein